VAAGRSQQLLQQQGRAALLLLLLMVVQLRLLLSLQRLLLVMVMAARLQPRMRPPLLHRWVVVRRQTQRAVQFCCPAAVDSCR
jgi:hypothetical protein